MPEESQEQAPPADQSLLEEIENAACDYAREAGRVLRRHFGALSGVEFKDKRESDPVTAADREVEEAIRRSVGERFPGHAVLGEEAEETGDCSGYVWVVDPLDGTLNFINGLPFFGVSIGVLRAGRPLVGVLHFPATGELLHARSGGGAYRGEERLRVREARKLEPRLLAGLPPHYRAGFRVALPVARRMGDSRSVGSIAYEIGLVASGGFAFAAFRGPSLWDVAGGVVIVREAGGLVLTFDGGERRWEALEQFTAPAGRHRDGRPRTLRDWRAPVLMGAPAVVRQIAPYFEPRGAPRLLSRLLGRYLR